MLYQYSTNALSINQIGQFQAGEVVHNLWVQGGGKNTLFVKLLFSRKLDQTIMQSTHLL